MIACLNHKKRERQRKERNEDTRCLFVFNVCYRVLFNFVFFSVLGADGVFTGKWHADAVCGRPNVCDDGMACHRGEGKEIINGCTNGSKEIPIRQQLREHGVSVVGNNNVLTMFVQQYFELITMKQG